ncbi:MAG TPA: UDP-N-acetylmuramoyl-L-alanyl-D-glutamate--2,6-diaminopimelate ligase [Intrasporangium sp.]|uniref:UDP-N-acetylmuramoyl-L-alanyl-D-glutamate--2, 6-diaminopimelate ligase n=1 Tax=Intrasporangium sp. TaxID=1925024 RepID=UPI002B478843|nr:UDP-N-acetylmuramoyl-L-alanyl-D-glutamate--2,6-diaminopimelate ligase [Intrasporangium sp.]HKX66978.1 UDP-N-acetylmuramoyl-L-alanyl-D-glutamate--2,6-diaminopimelate ligase [Intrasporangium sp.]
MSPDLIRPSTSGVSLRVLAGPSGGLRPAQRATDVPPDLLVTGVSLDSRAIRPGDLYAALPGHHVHGARFAADAVRLGAVAVVTDDAGAAAIEEHGALNIPVLVSDSPRARLGRIAATVYGDPGSDLTMIGITGTNGKTTTAYLLESALRALGRRTGLIGTVETRIGEERLDSAFTTPESPDLHAFLAVMRERGADTCVMEVSSHALHQHRVDGVVYDVALFTNLSQDHLDYHHSMDDYFEAKASLFTPERCVAGVVCIDDEWGCLLLDRATVPVTTLTTTGSDGPDADWAVAATRPDGAPGPGPAAGPGAAQRGAFRLYNRSGDVSLDLVSHLPGSFNIANTAIAAVALMRLGFEPDHVQAALAVPPVVPGRMEVVSEGGGGEPRCIVDFAHTPDAIDAALTALRPSTSGRLIAVLGAGGDRDRSKREAMGVAAGKRADVVIVTDDNPRSEDPATIREAVLAGAQRVVREGGARATEVLDGGSRTQAINEAVAMAVRGSIGSSGSGAVDTVVVLGKGHEKGQEIHGVKHPFDDRDAVRSALSAAVVGGAR